MLLSPGSRVAPGLLVTLYFPLNSEKPAPGCGLGSLRGRIVVAGWSGAGDPPQEGSLDSGTRLGCHVWGWGHFPGSFLGACGGGLTLPLGASLSSECRAVTLF